MDVKLLSITSDAEALIARCARVSHRSTGTGPEDDARLIRKLIKLGHESVLEFGWAAFLIEGVSRACANQLTRHRLLSVVQESQRYVDQSGATCVVPKGLEPYATEMARAVALYKRLVQGGVPREDARYLLPLGIETRLAVAANFREWLHIIRLRTAPDAQWEIRAVCMRIRDILRKHAPTVFGEEIDQGAVGTAGGF